MNLLNPNHVICQWKIIQSAVPASCSRIAEQWISSGMLHNMN